jgi:hypothetical protein
MDGNEVECEVYTAWDNRKAFVQDFLGYSYVDATPTLKRHLPEYHKKFTWMYAMEMILEKGCGYVTYAGGQQAFRTATGNEGLAKYRAMFKAVNYSILTDAVISGYGVGGEVNRYVTRLKTYAQQNLEYPGGTFQFVTAGQAITLGGGGSVVTPIVKDIFANIYVPTPTQEITYIWHDVPQSNAKLTSPLIGTVNGDYFDTNNVSFVSSVAANGTVTTTAGYPPYTLLLLPIDEKPIISIDNGAIHYEITYKMIFRPNLRVIDNDDGTQTYLYLGHNSLWRPDLIPPRYDGVRRRNDPNKSIYEPSDFRQLFHLTAPTNHVLQGGGVLD